MATNNELCNLEDKRELDYLRSLKEKGIDGKRMLKDVGGFNPETGALRVGNIRLDKFAVSDEVKTFMGDAIKEANYYIEQRRGTINWEKNAELAAEIRPRLKLKPGQIINSEETESLANVLGGLSIKAQEAAAVATADPSEKNRALALAARTEYDVAMATFSGNASEQGRALQIHRKIMTAIDAKDYDFMRKALKLGKKGKLTADQVTALTAKVDKNDPFAQYRFLRDMRKHQVGDYIMELWYNGILSGPITQVRNLFGWVNAGFEYASHPAAVAYDIIRAKKTGTPRSIYLGEMGLKAQKQGLLGIVSGAKRGAYLMQKGTTLDDVMALELRKPEVIKGKLGAFVNIPKRLLGTTDSVARGMFQQYALYGEAFTTAKNEGLKGKAFDERVAKLMTEPTPEMLKAAQTYAGRNVFQDDGGQFLAAMSNLRSAFEVKGIQPIAFIIPFVETPANIYKLGYRASPAGFFGKNTNPREGARDFGRAMLGSMLLLGAAALFSNGRITGSGPSDQKKKDALYRTGWVPYSFKIGDKWYPYQNIVPINIALGWLGNFQDMVMFEGQNVDTTFMSTLLLRNAKSMLDQSFFSTLGGFFGAMTGSDREKQTFFNRFAVSVVPQFIQQSARFINPTSHQVTNLGDAFKQALGWTDGLATKYDVFGEPIQRQRAGGLPLLPSKEKISALEQKLSDLGVETIGMPGEMVGKRKMTDQQYSAFSKEVGKRLFDALSDNDILPADLAPVDAQDIVDQKRIEIYNDVRQEMFPGSSEIDIYSFDSETLQSPNNVMDKIVLYAKAASIDPVTAAQRIFTGQKIRRIDNGTIIVQRMELADSEQTKKELGFTEGSDLILDHTVSLQLGGGNDRTNLKLVPREIWADYTPVENYLGGLLRDNQITKQIAQKTIRKFKNGEITAEDVYKIR